MSLTKVQIKLRKTRLGSYVVNLYRQVRFEISVCRYDKNRKGFCMF